MHVYGCNLNKGSYSQECDTWSEMGKHQPKPIRSIAAERTFTSKLKTYTNFLRLEKNEEPDEIPRGKEYNNILNKRNLHVIIRDRGSNSSHHPLRPPK